MPDRKWIVVKKQMRDECKRVAQAWDVPVQNVTLSFGIHEEEPFETWAFSVRLEGDKLRRAWNTSGYGDTFKEAADDSIERAEWSQR